MHTRLHQLRLLNFRRFADLHLTFDPDLTVIVAGNGAGKSTVLAAAVVAWRFLVESLGNLPAIGIDPTDQRLLRGPTGAMVPADGVAVEATGTLGGHPAIWKRERTAHKTTTKDTAPLSQYADALLQQARRHAEEGGPPPELPVFAYYGTGRLWDEGRLSKAQLRKTQDASLLTAAYAGSLDPKSTYALFSRWFEAAVREAQADEHRPVKSPARPAELVAAVRDATDLVLAPTGWRRLDWDFLLETIVADHDEQGRLPVDFLSDGVRNTLALVADLAHRCVRLNPHHGREAPRRCSGVVLIDELEMHLHPAWQQTIVGALRTAFPNLQFILTTHSPQVITTIPAECIRILHGEQVYAAPAGTEGAEASRVLESVFGVMQRPSLPIADTLAHYTRLVHADRWDTPEATALRRALDEHFRGQEPALIELDLVIETKTWERGA